MVAFHQRYLSSQYNLYIKFLLASWQLQLGIFWSIGWNFGTAKLLAATHNISPQLNQQWNLVSKSPKQVTANNYLENLQNTTNSAVTENSSQLNQQNLASSTKQVTSTHLENFYPTPPSKIKSSLVRLQHQLAPTFLLAAPENFNPSLRSPPPKPPPPPPKPKPPKLTKPLKPIAVLESIQTDFHNDTDNFGQGNLFIEPTAQFRFPNGNRLRIKTGFNSFKESEIETITNIPIQIGWQGKIDRVTLQTAVGVDLFNRLPTELNLNAKVEAPISQNVDSSGRILSAVVLSGSLEHGAYKFNAQTLNNEITTWRFGPDLYWQIDRYTSLFSSFRFGNYSDGNYEQQLFSRLERKLGQFSLAANLFNWSYTRDFESESGYFSPPDFLVYNAEVAWEGDVFDFLRCRLSATLGRQRLEGELDNASGYQARCTAQISDAIEADLGYSFSNVRNQDRGDSAYNNRSLTGQLRIKF